QVENVVGAGGLIGAARAAQAAPDGYTILVHNEWLATPAPSSVHTRPDPRAQFEPIGLISSSPFVILTAKTHQATSLEQLKGRLGQTPVAAFVGQGSRSHICARMLEVLLGKTFLFVPF